MVLTRYKPRPEPPVALLRERSMRAKGVNSRSSSSSGMVTPVFRTSSRSLVSVTDTDAPGGEWRTALLTMLCTARSSRAAEPVTVTPSARLALMSVPRSYARGRMSAMTPPASAAISTVSALPAKPSISRRVISSISATSFSMCSTSASVSGSTARASL